MEEQWYKIKKFPQFSITKTGRVKNDVTGRELNYNRSKFTYRFCFDGRKVDRNIKNLLAETFIPNPNNCKNVLLKDENEANFSLDNIYWAETNKEPTLLSVGQIINEYTVIEDLYEFKKSHNIKVVCNKCSKETVKTYSLVINETCGCDSDRKKSKEDRNKDYLKKDKCRLIHTMGEETSKLLCRKCRQIEEVPTDRISNKVSVYCCGGKEKTKKENYQAKIVRN